MVLESTVICLDNSDWMRNGDYAPRRFDAQMDAAGILCNSRTNSNPENTVGILTMAGQGVEMLVSPTEEIGKILACFAKIHVNGAHSDLSTAVQIAQLALKHRKNKNGGQRIIAFVGGPLQDSVESLQKIGKQLKKNNVAVDIILMGEIEENNEKLTEFVNATSSNDNSHLITVPPGMSPSNALFSSPVMSEHGGAHMMGGFGGGTVGGGAGGSGGAGGGDFDMYGGIDPSMDPELAMAIRSSMEEARAQEESRVNALQKETAAAGGSSSSSGSSSSGGAVPFGGFGATDEEDEEALIQRALEMSMADANNSSGGSNSADVPPATPKLPSTLNSDENGIVMREENTKSMEVEVDAEEAEDDEEAELRRALQLSVADAGGVVDSEFVDQLLQGTDLDDPLVQAALAQLNASNNKDNNKDNKEGDNSKKRKGDEA